MVSMSYRVDILLLSAIPELTKAKFQNALQVESISPSLPRGCGLLFEDSFPESLEVDRKGSAIGEVTPGIVISLKLAPQDYCMSRFSSKSRLIAYYLFRLVRADCGWLYRDTARRYTK